MEDNKFNQEFSSESVSALIVQFRAYKTAGYSLKSKWAKAIIQHLSERELTEEERKLFDHILSSTPTTLRDESEERMEQKRKDSANQPISKGTEKHPGEDEKYPALRTISSVFIVLGVLVALASLFGGIYYFTKGEAGIVLAISTILGGAMTTLLLVAASELIGLFIDIEKNTRQSAKKD